MGKRTCSDWRKHIGFRILYSGKTGGSKYLQSHTHTFTGTAVTVTGGSHSHTLPYPVPSEPGYDYEGESYNAPFGTYSPQSELIEETDSETHSHTFTAKVHLVQPE